MRVLPADVYDTLEFTAMVFGGVGAGIAFDDAGTDRQKPCCVLGLSEAAANIDFSNIGPEDAQRNPVSAALARVNIWGGQNDDAVARINERTGKKPYERVSFREWCAELEVVRGDE